jgi:hypothetical protein
LVVVRIAFGAVMAWEVTRYFRYDWIARYWIDPPFNFSYPLFGWLQPWPGDGMYWHFYLLGVLALFIALGLFYRLSMTLFFFAFSYTFLLEEARYLNHFYLVCLFSFISIFVPAHRWLSLDALIWPRIRSTKVPTWSLLLVQAQIGIPYFFGGVAKLNGDWLRGAPMDLWLGDRTDFPLIGPLFTNEWVVYFFSYNGILLDLLIVPLLLWRRTRAFSFAAIVLFHFLNAKLFSIGIFPWMMIILTTVFFPADWPRQLLTDLRERPRWHAITLALGGLLGGIAAPWSNQGVEVIPITAGILAGVLIPWLWLRQLRRIEDPRPAESESPWQWRPVHRLTVVLLTAWLAIQVTVPFRHYAIAGNVSWTEHGHRFSWHMKLRHKEGLVRFVAFDPTTGKTWELDPSESISLWQYKKMAVKPHMILQFAHHLAEQLRAEGYEDIETHAQAIAALNGRPPQLLVDPQIDLVSQKLSIRPQPWIVALAEPLPDQPYLAEESADEPE